MDMAALFLLFIFAIVFSMLFNYGGPKFIGYATAKPWGQKIAGNYAGRTLLTAVTVFIFLVAVSLVFSAVKERPALPSI